MYFFGIHGGMLNVWVFGALINLTLGLFNMIPAFPLDGSKVMAWNRFVWAGMTFGMLAIGFLLGAGISFIISWALLLVLALVFSKLLFG
jgi:Zn-dependent protease